ncbi:Integrin, alpha, partial [Cichlidogyrus casuarinus]
HGRFGHSLANLGDVDGDGTEDLAVGCPFCKLGDSKETGAVFIYLGNKSTNPIQDSPMQVIFPEEFSKDLSQATVCEDTWEEVDTKARPFRAFGWSLSGDFDMDKNRSPDLIVGDMLSSQVVVVKSRSLIWFENAEWNVEHDRVLLWKGPEDTYCSHPCKFILHLTAVIRGRRDFLENLENDLFLKVTVDLDSQIETEHEKRLGDSSNSTSVTATGPSVTERMVPVRLLRESSRRISLLNLVVEPKLRAVRGNKWQPLLVNATIEPFSGKEEVVNWTLHPYLGKREFHSPIMHFANDECSNNVCRSDLQVVIYDISQGIANSSVIFFGETPFSRNVSVRVRNLGENAYKAKLQLLVPKQLSVAPPNGMTCVGEDGDNVQVVSCSLGDPLRTTGPSYAGFVFQLNVANAFKQKNVTLAPNSMMISAQVSSGNPDLNLFNNEARWTYELIYESKIQITSASADKTTVDERNRTVNIIPRTRVFPSMIGPEVKHVYLVTNEGPSPLENIWVNISVPMFTKSGERLLYILDEISYDADSVVSLSPKVRSVFLLSFPD